MDEKTKKIIEEIIDENRSKEISISKEIDGSYVYTYDSKKITFTPLVAPNQN